MASKQPSGSAADLQGVLEAAGGSLAGAQGGLSEDGAATGSLMISDAELEIKAALSQEPGGKLGLKTITSSMLTSGSITAAAISTVRVRYVVVASEPQSVAAPSRPKDEIVKGVRGREDVARLEKVLGGLDVQPVFVPETRKWVVTVKDSHDRLVREIIVPDEVKEGHGG